MRDTAEKLRKSMEQSTRQQSDYMTTKEQLSAMEKAKVRNTRSRHGKRNSTDSTTCRFVSLHFCFSKSLKLNSVSCHFI